jgi:hypothetical protein
MLKFNSMTKVGFLIQNGMENLLYSIFTKVNSFKIPNGLHKTIIIVSLTIFLTLFISSCKTCKCPAYSQIESQKPANMADATI